MTEVVVGGHKLCACLLVQALPCTSVTGPLDQSRLLNQRCSCVEQQNLHTMQIQSSTVVLCTARTVTFLISTLAIIP